MPFMVFVIIVVVAALLLSSRKTNREDIIDINMEKVKSKLKYIVGFIIIAVILIKSIVIIGPGKVGVIVLFGKVNDNPVPSGMHLINPLASVVRMSVRTEEYTMSIVGSEGKVSGDDAIDALTKEGLKIKLDMTSWYHLDSKAAPIVYRTIGANYEDKIVRPALRTAIRDAVVRYTAADIYTEKRTEVIADIERVITDLTRDRGIIIEKVLLRNVILPPKLTDAIDAKQSAEQAAQQMEFVLQKEQKEQERKIIEAEGIKQANQIIAAGLTPNYLKWYRIDMMKQLVNSPNNTVIFIPEGLDIAPIINIPNPNK